MIKLRRAAFFLSLTLIFSACTSAMKTPELKQNPNPKQRYEVTMSINDAPGPFDSITGYVVYQVLNDICVALQPGSGARLAPHLELPITLTRTGEFYKGSFYADQMMDEDYYGLGVCKWALTIAGVKLKQRTNTFRAHLAIDANNVISEQPGTLYFFNAIYTDHTIDNYRDDGSFQDPKHKQFSVTTTVKARVQ